MLLEMCCNHWKDGSPLGKSEAVQIGDIEFEGPEIVTRLRADGRLQFGRCIIPISNYKKWFGNWCWNAAVVEPLQGLRAANILISKGWRITAGPSDLYDIAADGKPIDEAVWMGFFEE